MGYLGRVGLTRKNRVGSRVNPFFVSGQKNRVWVMFFRVGSENSDLYCHVYWRGGGGGLIVLVICGGRI